MLGVPLPRHDLETVRLPCDGRRFPCTAVFAGVDASRNLLACLIPSLSRVLQTCVGVGAEGQQLLFAIELVLEAPPFAALGADEQEQPPLIVEFGLLGLGLGFPDRGVCKRHLG